MSFVFVIPLHAYINSFKDVRIHLLRFQFLRVARVIVRVQNPIFPAIRVIVPSKRQ